MGYARCRDCGHTWLLLAASDEELRRHYNTDYEIPRELYAATAAREYPPIARLLARFGYCGGRLLEIGCSYGDMLSHFANDGWTVQGIELDARAAADARERLGLSVQAGTLATAAGLEPKTFDCITAFHVLEHIADPLSFLSKVSTLLGPHGVLLLRLPNASSLAARSPAGSWEWYLRPEHPNLFSSESLRRLLCRAGLEPVFIGSRRGDANTTLFEWIKGFGRWVLRGHRDGTDSGRDVGARSARRTVSAARTAINLVGSPVEALIGAGDLLSHPIRPELIVLARPLGR